MSSVLFSLAAIVLVCAPFGPESVTDPRRQVGALLEEAEGYVGGEERAAARPAPFVAVDAGTRDSSYVGGAGTVVDIKVQRADARPAAHIEVLARRLRDWLPDDYSLELDPPLRAQTDESGNARLTVMPGTYRIIAWGADGEGSKLLAIAPEVERSEATIDLEEAARAGVRIVGSGEKAVASLVVTASDPELHRVYKARQTSETSIQVPPNRHSVLSALDARGNILGIARLVPGIRVVSLNVESAEFEGVDSVTGVRPTHTALIKTGDGLPKVEVIFEGLVQKSAKAPSQVLWFARAMYPAGDASSASAATRMITVQAEVGAGDTGGSLAWAGACVRCLVDRRVGDVWVETCLDRDFTDRAGRCRILIPTGGAFRLSCESPSLHARSITLKEGVAKVEGTASRADRWYVGAGQARLALLVPGRGSMVRMSTDLGFFDVPVGIGRSFAVTDWPGKDYRQPPSFEYVRATGDVGVWNLRNGIPRLGNLDVFLSGPKREDRWVRGCTVGPD